MNEKANELNDEHKKNSLIGFEKFLQKYEKSE